jgi:hypothetical protein
MAQLQRPKMLWYYDSIINWMIANPGKPLYECAAAIGRTPATLSVIINSDMFKAALAKRKDEFHTQHDIGLIEKNTKIAHASLDAILDTLTKRGSAIPLDSLKELSDSALTRLGYGMQKQPAESPAAVQVNVVVPVSATDLAEARMALRQVQAQKAGTPLLEAKEAGLRVVEASVSDAPTSDPT